VRVSLFFSPTIFFAAFPVLRTIIHNSSNKQLQYNIIILCAVSVIVLTRARVFYIYNIYKELK